MTIINTQRLVALYEKSEHLLGDLIEIFLEDTPYRMRRLAGALAAGDARWAERIAHTLKSNAATLGAEAMQAVALEMEIAARANDLDRMRALVATLQGEVSSAQAELAALARRKMIRLRHGAPTRTHPSTSRTVRPESNRGDPRRGLRH